MAAVGERKRAAAAAKAKGKAKPKAKAAPLVPVGPVGAALAVSKAPLELYADRGARGAVNCVFGRAGGGCGGWGVLSGSRWVALPWSQWLRSLQWRS